VFASIRPRQRCRQAALQQVSSEAGQTGWQIDRQATDKGTSRQTDGSLVSACPRWVRCGAQRATGGRFGFDATVRLYCGLNGRVWRGLCLLCAMVAVVVVVRGPSSRTVGLGWTESEQNRRLHPIPSHLPLGQALLTSFCSLHPSFFLSSHHLFFHLSSCPFLASPPFCSSVSPTFFLLHRLQSFLCKSSPPPLFASLTWFCS